MTFAERLRELRKEKQWTQEELANQVGISKRTISAYEVGRRRPDFETLEQLGYTLDTAIDYLLGTSDNRRAYRSQEENYDELAMLNLADEMYDLFKRISELDPYGIECISCLCANQRKRCIEMDTLIDRNTYKITVVPTACIKSDDDTKPTAKDDTQATT